MPPSRTVPRVELVSSPKATCNRSSARSPSSRLVAAKVRVATCSVAAPPVMVTLGLAVFSSDRLTPAPLALRVKSRRAASVSAITMPVEVVRATGTSAISPGARSRERVMVRLPVSVGSRSVSVVSAPAARVTWVLSSSRIPMLADLVLPRT